MGKEVYIFSTWFNWPLKWYRLVKRYSALVIGNQVARVIIHAIKPPEYEFVGGYAGQKRGGRQEGMYKGPAHIVDQLNSVSYGKIIRR